MRKAYVAPDIQSEKVEATALATSTCTCGCPSGDIENFVPAAVSNFLS